MFSSAILFSFPIAILNFLLLPILILLKDSNKGSIAKIVHFFSKFLYKNSENSPAAAPISIKL